MPWIFWNRKKVKSFFFSGLAFVNATLFVEVATFWKKFAKSTKFEVRKTFAAFISPWSVKKRATCPLRKNKPISKHTIRNAGFWCVFGPRATFLLTFAQLYLATPLLLHLISKARQEWVENQTALFCDEHRSIAWSGKTNVEKQNQSSEAVRGYLGKGCLIFNSFLSCFWD